MVPTVIFSVCGLNAKLPLLIIDTFTVVGDVGVGVGVVLVGVGLGRDGVGVAFVGVGLGRDGFGVTVGGVDVGESFVVPTIAVPVSVGEAVLLATLPLPSSQPASTTRRSITQKPHKTMRRNK